MATQATNARDEEFQILLELDLEFDDDFDGMEDEDYLDELDSDWDIDETDQDEDFGEDDFFVSDYFGDDEDWEIDLLDDEV